MATVKNIGFLVVVSVFTVCSYFFVLLLISFAPFLFFLSQSKLIKQQFIQSSARYAYILPIAICVSV